MVHVERERSIELPQARQHAAPNEPVGAGVPEHPRVADALARAVVQALIDGDAIGVALLRSMDWAHVMTSATYERLVGQTTTLGMPVSDVLPERTAPRAMLEAVVATGKAARSADVLERTETVHGLPVSVHVSFTFLRVRRVTADADGVLVLANDVSQEIHEHRIGELFVALASDMSVERDETASIRSSVSRASEALGADATSIFLLSPNGKGLHGALVGWDWTRTSFVAEVENWPNVADAIARNEAGYVTAQTAQLAEEAWFERRGIKAAICAPMTAHGRVLGVLFFDYLAPKAAQVDLGLAKDIADQCALLIERAAARST
jgi:hypothetical protein